MKIRKTILVVFITSILLVYLVHTLFIHQYPTRTCIEAEDGYIWYINGYNFGTYHVMGWQGGSWGNPVTLEKIILERKNIDGFSVYTEVTCPEYSDML